MSMDEGTNLDVGEVLLDQDSVSIFAEDAHCPGRIAAKIFV